MRRTALSHKLRWLIKSNKTGDCIGITLPKEMLIGNQQLIELVGTTFYIFTSGNSIILESGCKTPTELSMKEINKIVIEEKRIVI